VLGPFHPRGRLRVLVRPGTGLVAVQHVRGLELERQELQKPQRRRVGRRVRRPGQCRRRRPLRDDDLQVPPREGLRAELPPAETQPDQLVLDSLRVLLVELQEATYSPAVTPESSCQAV